MWIGELFVREKVPSKLPLSTTPENLPVDGFPAIETIAFTLQKRSSCTDGCCGAAAPFYFIFVNHKEKERERRFAVSLAGLGDLQQKNLPPGGFSGLCESEVCQGGFSLTKAPSFAIRNSDCKIHPQRRLNDKSFSISAELDQQALPAGHPLPFEKEAKLDLVKS